jgi:hypothetical protein
MTTENCGFIIHCGYEGFVAGENKNGTFEYADQLIEAKKFSNGEIGDLYESLEIDHPGSKMCILTLEEAEKANLKHLKPYGN